MAAIRSLLVLLLLAVYVAAVRGVCTLLRPAPPIHRAVTGFVTTILTRAALFIIGLFWIPVEHVSRKRGRGRKLTEGWAPKPGDLIVSNWVSWVEIMWLVCRFNPIFILPVFDPLPHSPTNPSGNTSVCHTPGRRTGTGSANVSLPAPSAPRSHFRGFRSTSFLELIHLTGKVPPYGCTECNTPCMNFEEIRKSADRPVVIFPECTTSNGRGLLRFSNILPFTTVPSKDFGVFVMCVRYDPPTSLTPSISLAIPSRILNPLAHLFSLSTSFVPLAISIRLLDPADSPGSQLFITSDVVSDASNEDVFVETCATLIAQLGKLKRTGMGWEDKSSFFEFYQARKH